MRPRDTGASRSLRRWIPALAAPIVIGAAIVLVPMQANAAVDLPDLGPDELLEFAASSDVDALSGTIEQTSDLGIPDLSGLTGTMGGGAGGGAGASGFGSGDRDGGDEASASATDLDDLVALATGTHTAKVYLDGENARLQVLDRLAERNVYVSEDGAWVYDSRRAGGDARHRRPGRARRAEGRTRGRGRCARRRAGAAPRDRARRAAPDTRGAARPGARGARRDHGRVRRHRCAGRRP